MTLDSLMDKEGRWHFQLGVVHGAFFIGSQLDCTNPWFCDND